jgi:hypothetical protein
VEARSRGFASQHIAANWSLTFRFVVSCCPLLSPRLRSSAAQAAHSTWAQLPTGLSGAVMANPQRKAAASRTVADWLVMQFDGDQPAL